MKLSPICWAAAFSAALPWRRALRRGPLAGTGAVPGGGADGGGGGGAVVATLGGLARGSRGRGRGFGLVSSSHRWRSWAMPHQPSEPPDFVVIRNTLMLEGVVQCSTKVHLGAPGGPRVGHPARKDHARQSAHGHARDVISIFIMIFKLKLKVTVK
jgi:hypothetical protein